ncbi:MAG: hypothetical protein ABI467_20135 [Kofleriaceae bacterium]
MLRAQTARLFTCHGHPCCDQLRRRSNDKIARRKPTWLVRIPPIAIADCGSRTDPGIIAAMGYVLAGAGEP